MTKILNLIKEVLKKEYKIFIDEGWRSVMLPESEAEKESFVLPQTIHGDEKLKISWKNTFSTFFVSLVFIGFFSFVILSFWNSEGLQSPPTGLEPVLYSLSGLFALLGGFNIYSFLAGCFNHSKFSVRNGKLSVSRGPLPWFTGLKEISVTEINQVFIKEYTSLSPERMVSFYKVLIRTSTGEVLLQSRLARYEDALTVEYWIERKLNLANTDVEGESKLKYWYNVA